MMFQSLLKGLSCIMPSFIMTSKGFLGFNSLFWVCGVLIGSRVYLHVNMQKTFLMVKYLLLKAEDEENYLTVVCSMFLFISIG